MLFYDVPYAVHYRLDMVGNMYNQVNNLYGE